MAIFKSKKPTPSQSLQHVAKVANGVKELLKKGVVKIVGNTVYLYSELWYDKKTAEAWIKNVYMYCCLYTQHEKEKPLYFKNIETEEVLGFYQDKKATVLI